METKILESSSGFRVGDVVTVVAGRKIPHGTQARIARIEDDGSVVVMDLEAWNLADPVAVWMNPKNLSVVQTASPV